MKMTMKQAAMKQMTTGAVTTDYAQQRPITALLLLLNDIFCTENFVDLTLPVTTASTLVAKYFTRRVVLLLHHNMVATCMLATAL